MVKIFVGNLTPGTQADDIKHIFVRYGKVSECDVIKQFAFVHMDNETEAYKAIACLNDTWLKGVKIHVKLSHDGMVKIFVGNLRSTTTSEDLRELFEQFGNVFDSDVIDGKYGFVHMESEDAAKTAISRLDDTELQGNRIRVSLSHGNKKSGNKGGGGGRKNDDDRDFGRRRGSSSSGPVKLFVGNITTDVKPGELRDLFEKYGRVVECALLDKYAFVHMERDCDANDAIDGLNDSTFCGSRINVEFGRSTRRQQPGGHSDSHHRNGGSGGRRDMGGPGPMRSRGGHGMSMHGGGGFGGGNRIDAPGLLGYSAADALRNLPLESLGAAMNPWLNLQLSTLASGATGNNCCGGHSHRHGSSGGRRDYDGRSFDDRSPPRGSSSSSRNHPYSRDSRY